MNRKFTKLLNTIFVLGLLICLCACTLRTFFMPKEINVYENRYANKVQPFTVKTFASGAFQEGVEKALSDQIPNALTLQKFYNDMHSEYTVSMMRKLLSNYDDRYFNILGGLVFGGDQLTYYTRPLEDEKIYLEAKARNYNALFKKYPDIEFYSYYIEKDTDIYFDTGVKTGVSQYIMNLLDLPPRNKGIFSIDDYQTFRSFFYRTDHHWNYKGSYYAYQDVLKLLGCSDDPIEPERTVLVHDSFSGSKASGMNSDLFREPFYVYQFSFPHLTYRINNKPEDDYGYQQWYIENSSEEISYGSFYGWDYGEVIIESDHDDRENILVLGDSYDNAILKLLATHFHKIYSVDLRNYEHFLGHPFHFDEYVKQHKIDKVLLIGNIDFYDMSEFEVKF